jgi:hypothetical protein
MSGRKARGECEAGRTVMEDDEDEREESYVVVW